MVSIIKRPLALELFFKVAYIRNYTIFAFHREHLKDFSLQGAHMNIYSYPACGCQDKKPVITSNEPILRVGYSYSGVAQVTSFWLLSGEFNIELCPLPHRIIFMPMQ